MPITIIATPGATDANSFVTIAEADAYVDLQMVRTGWPVADDDKARALIAATADLSALHYVGSRAQTAQALAWPRTGAPNPDARQDGYYPFGAFVPEIVWYAEDVIPQRVKDATCELAYRYAVAGRPDTGTVLASQNILEEQVDVLRVKYSDPAARASGIGLYPRVVQWLQPLLANVGGLTVYRQ
jgi:hypothetical protein